MAALPQKAMQFIYILVGGILVIAGMLTIEVGIGLVFIPLGAGMLYYGLKGSGVKGVPG